MVVSIFYYLCVTINNKGHGNQLRSILSGFDKRAK